MQHEGVAGVGSFRGRDRDEGLSPAALPGSRSLSAPCDSTPPSRSVSVTDFPFIWTQSRGIRAHPAPLGLHPN